MAEVGVEVVAEVGVEVVAEVGVEVVAEVGVQASGPSSGRRWRRWRRRCGRGRGNRAGS